jgi:hypothetical protein
MAKFAVIGETSIMVYTVVEAESAEAAMALVKEDPDSHNWTPHPKCNHLNQDDLTINYLDDVCEVYE